MSSFGTNSSITESKEVATENKEEKKGDVTNGEKRQTSPPEGAGAVIAAARAFIRKPLESAEARLAMNARIMQCLGGEDIRSDYKETLHTMQNELWMMSEPGAERQQHPPFFDPRGSGHTLSQTSQGTQKSFQYTSDLHTSSEGTM